MAITALQIVQNAYRLLGRPSDTDIPYQDIIDTARDVYRGMAFDLKLSDRGHTLAKSDWYTPTAEEDVNLTSFSLSSTLTNIIPVKVEWRPAGSTAKPRVVQVVSYDSLSDLYYKARSIDETYIAFYGTNLVAFSEKTATLAGREYRIIYEDTEDITFSSISDSATAFPEIVAPYWQYKTALLCLDLVRNESPEWESRRERIRMSILPAYEEWERRFTKWYKSLWGNRKAKKVGYRARRR